MEKTTNSAGQIIDYKEHNDNAPPSHSAPSTTFKSVLKYYSNNYCRRCNGTGYLGKFKDFSAGRCFECIPDEYWGRLLGDSKAIGIDDETREEVCEIRYISDDVYRKSGFGVFDKGIPPIGEFKVFQDYEKALIYAKDTFGI